MIWVTHRTQPHKVDAFLTGGFQFSAGINIANVAINKNFKQHLWMVTGRSSRFVSRVKRIKIDLINYIINYADWMGLRNQFLQTWR